MSQYSEAWKELRDKHTLTIVAPTYWHKRIYNGIRKARYKDLVHSMYLAEHKLVDRVTHKSEGTKMIFELQRIPAPQSLTFSFKELF